jgi:hypothetical protein
MAKPTEDVFIRVTGVPPRALVLHVAQASGRSSSYRLPRQCRYLCEDGTGARSDSRDTEEHDPVDICRALSAFKKDLALELCMAPDHGLGVRDHCPQRGTPWAV